MQGSGEPGAVGRERRPLLLTDVNPLSVSATATYLEDAQITTVGVVGGR